MICITVTRTRVFTMHVALSSDVSESALNSVNGELFNV